MEIFGDHFHDIGFYVCIRAHTDGLTEFRQHIITTMQSFQKYVVAHALLFGCVLNALPNINEHDLASMATQGKRIDTDYEILAVVVKEMESWLPGVAEFKATVPKYQALLLREQKLVFIGTVSEMHSQVKIQVYGSLFQMRILNLLICLSM